MNNKIKELRRYIGLSEVQISSLLNISSYKYKRYENGSLLVSVDILILLSIMYDVSIDLLIFDKFNMESICKEASIKELLKVPPEERIMILETNMCRHCTFACNTINYRVVKNILVRFLNEFSNNLQKLRCSQLLEISELALVIQSNVEYYVNLECGKVWPSVFDLLQLSTFFSKSANEIVGLEDEVDA